MKQRQLFPAFLAALFGAVLIATPLAAATFTFVSEVTVSSGPSATPGTPSLPPVGTVGSIDLTIDDSNPALALFSGVGDPNVVASASVTVPGWISGAMTNTVFDSFTVTDSYFSFGAYGPSSVAVDNGATIQPSSFHVFRVNFGAPLLAAPTTTGELVAAISAPGASGFFSHELDLSGDGFIVTRVSFPASVAAVPLPASAWLLGLALLGMGALRRRV